MVTEGPDLNTAANVLAHPASKGVQAAIHSDQTKLTPGQQEGKYIIRGLQQQTWAPSCELLGSKSRPVDCKPKMCHSIKR